MLKSRVAVFLIALLSCLSASAFACGDHGQCGKYEPYTMYRPMDGRLTCFTVRGHYRHGVYVPRHRVCVARPGYYVCKKYVYEVTPIHRDKYCSKWEWISPYYHHYHKHHHHYPHCHR